MKKVLIISFYDLKDYLSCIKELIEEYYFEVFSYPLFRYAYDANDKIENYKEHLDEYIKNINPDIILWWFIDVPTDIFSYIKKQNKDIYYILYNSDDPINISKDLFDKAKIFDLVITSCKESMYLYKLYSNVKDVIFGPMGYDEGIFFNLDDKLNNEIVLPEKEEFECDMSMIVYNLFECKEIYNQTIYRLDLINILINYCKEKNLKFKLYGVPILSQYFKEYYCGDVPYFKLNYVYNYSKINIISSPSYTKNLCLSQNLMSILGSGGMVLHDKIKGIYDILPEECIYDGENLIQKLDYILNNNIKINNKHIAEKFNWNNWVKNIMRIYGKTNFNEEIYSKLYNIDYDNKLDYWLNIGLNNKEFCYIFEIPENFNYQDYCDKFNLVKDKHIAYFHWYINGQNKIFLKNKKNNTIELNKCNIIMENYYDICSIFNKINNSNNLNEGLIELENYCNKIPYIDINEILNNYIKSL